MTRVPSAGPEDPSALSAPSPGPCWFAILQARYCLAYLFEYLATLGMIDVAYTTPYHARRDFAENWATDDFVLLSRYDGLRYIRLNALGAFCLGMDDCYQPAVGAKPPLLCVDSDFGLALLRDPEPGERLICEPVGQTQLQQVLAALGWHGDDAVPLSSMMCKPLRERLLADGLLVKTRNSLTCPPELLDPLTRQTVADGTFADIVTAAERLIPTKPRSSWERPSDERRLPLLRNALYAG